MNANYNYYEYGNNYNNQEETTANADLNNNNNNYENDYSKNGYIANEYNEYDYNEYDNNGNGNKNVNNENTNKDENNNKTTKEINVDDFSNFDDNYKAGIFEEVLNGPRGPDIRLHRHSLSVGFLKLFIILFVTAGIVLLSVIMLCITINVGYVCVQIDTINSLVQMIFFVYYSNALYVITRSIWRTYLRLIHTIMVSRFGANVHDIFIKRVLGYFISEKIALMTIPNKYKSHPKDWYEVVNLVLFVIFILILLSPFPLIAIFFGYGMISSIICLVFVIGGAISILGLNLISRIILFTKFFRRLDDFYYNAPSFIDIKERINNQTQYLRITYCTSNSLEGGYNYLNYALDRCLMIMIEITISSFIFGSFDPDVKKLTVMVEIIIVLIPIRLRSYIFKFFYKIFIKLKITSKGNLEKQERDHKKKIDEQMKETHKQYVNYKRLSVLNRRLSSTNPNANINSTPIINTNSTNLKTPSMTLFQPPIPRTNNNTLHNDRGSTSQVYNLNPNLSFQKSNEIDLTTSYTSKSESKEDSEDEEKLSGSFLNLIHTKNKHTYRKALLTWNIETLTSWKGCLTVFTTRFVKNIIGVGFMAFLNYNRYSVNSDTETTYNNLLVDILTHAAFLVLLLGQDIIYIIPASSSRFLMNTRKYFFMILLILEFCLVIGMRIIITNNYIPMAFIIIAYSNFTVHPDPRYTWDDEKVQRKTFSYL